MYIFATEIRQRQRNSHVNILEVSTCETQRSEQISKSKMNESFENVHKKAANVQIYEYSRFVVVQSISSLQHWNWISR